MELKPLKKSSSEENLIPLINIVFLILIFFLMATVIRPFAAKDIQLASAIKEESLHKLTHTLIIDKQGAMLVKGEPVNEETLPLAFTSLTHGKGHATLNIIADKALPAEKLIEIIGKLNKADFNKIKLVIEKAKK